MKSTVSRISITTITALLVLSVPAFAQNPPRKNIVSANPFGLLLEFFNAEYERVVGESSSIGFGGSSFSDEVDDGMGNQSDDRYVNADVFYRFYPSGNPVNGWSFGVKLGVTDVTDAGTFLGYGFDVNHSWTLGKRDNFYVGLGFGLKRLIGADEDEVGLEYIPTLRIVNIGIAF